MSGSTSAASLDDVVGATNILERMPCGIIVRDPTGQIAYANDVAHRIVGWPTDTLRGHKTVRREGVKILNRDGHIATTPTPAVLETGKPVYNVQHRFCFPGGEVRWVDATWLPMVSDDGTLQYVITTFVDITASVINAERGAWLENQVLQTLLGITLVLQNHESRRRDGDAANQDLDWAVSVLRSLASEIRRAARV